MKIKRILPENPHNPKVDSEGLAWCSLAGRSRSQHKRARGLRAEGNCLFS